ncbi:MAG: hypothetical protein ACI9XJ_000082 [Marivirga sp.]|jgi:hypothetical protein
MSRFFIKIIGMTIVGIFYFNSLSAQPGPPPPPPDNPVPITGIEYLIAAGAAFGAKKIYDKKKSV